MKRSRRSRSSSSFSLFLLLLLSFLCTLTFAQTQQTFNNDLPSNSISSANDNQDGSHSNQTWLSWKDQESLQRLMLTPPTTLPITSPIVIPLKSTFSPERVCLSFLVSFIGSITCLELLLKMSPRLSRKDREERQDTQSQASEISSSSNSSNTVKHQSRLRDFFNLHNHSWMWLLGAAFAFGGGTTWAMHFISINALYLHFPSPLPPAAFPIVFLNERPIPQGVETWSSSIKSPQAMLEQMLGLGKGDWNKANLWSFQELSSTLREHQVRIIDYPSALQLLELRHDNGGMLPVIYQGAYSTLGLACAIAGAFLAFLLLDFSIPTSRGTGEEGSDGSSRNWFNRAFRRSGRGKRTERREQEDRSSRGTSSIIERRGSDRAPSFDMRENPSSTRPSLISRSRAEGNQVAALSSAPPIFFQSSASTLGYFDVGYSITRATNPHIQDERAPSDRSSCSPPEESSKLLDTSRYHQQLAPGSTSTLVPSTPSSPGGLGEKLDKCSSPKCGSLREPSMDERRRESATTQVSAFEKEDKSSDKGAMDSLYLMNSISPGLTSGSISSTPGDVQKPLTMTPGEIALGEVEGIHSGSPTRQSSFFSPNSRDRSIAQQRILHQHSGSGASSTFSFASVEDQADVRGGAGNPNSSRRSSGGIALGSRLSGSRPASIIGMENQDRLADEVSLRSGSDYDSIDSAVRDHETVSRRRRMIRQALSAVLAGGGISAMHYASQSATLFVHYHYRPGYAIAGALSTVVIVFISFFILFDLLRPKLLNFFWARLPLAFLLSFASIMMHYTVVLGTSYYITTIQLADLLLNPGQWRSGRASRKSLIGLVASVATSLCITLAIVAIVSQRRTAKRKAKNAQQRIVLAVCLLDKNGDVLVDLDGNFPMVEIGQEDSVSPLDKFMSPRLPQFTSTSAQNKSSVKMAMRKMMVAFTASSSEQGTSATLQKLSTDQNVFARCLRKTWEWHSPASSSSAEQRSRSQDSRSSKEKASPQVSKLRFANIGAESSSTWKSSQDSSSKELQSSSRRRGETKKKSISDQDRLKNNLESFYLPTDRPRRSSHLKPTTGEHQEELMTLKQETAEERFERLFERAASDLSKLCWGSEEVEARGKLGVLYDRIIPVGHVKAGGSETLARGQMLVIVRKLNTLAERENLLRSGAGSRGFAFAEMSAVAKRAVGSKGLGLRADETLPLISDLSNFGSQRTSLADQVSRGKVYVSLVAVQSLLMGGLQIVVDPNLRHSLPMVELGDLSRVDGTQSFQSLGNLQQLKSSLKALSGHSLLSLIELTESLSEIHSQRRGSTSSLAGNKWILNLLPLQAPATTESQKEKLKEVDHQVMAQEKLIKSLVRTLVAFLDAFFPIETVSYLLSRLTLVSEVVALLPTSQLSKGNGRNPRFRNSAGSQHQIPKALEIDQAYSINFKVVIPPDTELPGLTWVPYLLFSAHNECRSKAPSSRFNRYSNLVEGRRRSRAQSIDGSKVRSNTSRTSADAANLSSSSIRPRASTLEPSSSTSFSSLKDQVQLVKNKMWTNGRAQRLRLHHHKRSSSEPNTTTLATASRSFRVPVSPSPSKVETVKSGYGDSGSLARSLEGPMGGGLRRRSIVPLSPVLSQHEDAEGEETETQTLGAAMTGIETSVRSSSDYEPPSSSSFSRSGIKFNQSPLLGVSPSSNERLFHSSIAFTLPFGEESSQPQAFSHRAIEIPIPPDCIPSSSITSSRFPSPGQYRPIRSNTSIQERDSSSSNLPQPFLHPFLPGAASSSRMKARFPIQDQSHLSEQRRQSAPSLIQTNASRNSSVDASESSPHYEADWISKLLRKQLVEDEEAFTVEKELKLDLGLLES